MKDYYKSEHFSAWDGIDWFTENLTGVNAFNAGNVIKYLCRCTKKGQYLSDLQKALEYMKLTTSEVNHNPIYSITAHSFCMEFDCGYILEPFIMYLMTGKEFEKNDAIELLERKIYNVSK